MFSGKTDELIREHARHSIPPSTERCLVFKFSSDRRYSADEHELVSLSGAKVAAHPVRLLAQADEIVQQQPGPCYISVDEGQFYNDLALYCIKWADRGCCVVVAALDGDARREPWENVSALIPHCDSIVKLSAVCSSCGLEAPFSSRKPVQESERIDIGSVDKYEALCRVCYSRVHAPTTL